jgi:hypothetical protein
MPEETAHIIQALLTELASELDLHYEDEDFVALASTIDHMRAAAALLERHGVAVPAGCLHVIQRHLRSRN